MTKVDDNIDKANEFGNLLNNWTKIAIVYGGAIISCAAAYYQIFENKDDISQEKKERLEHELSAEDRGDKRYKEAMAIAEELKLYIKYQQEEIVKMKEKQSYLEGYIKGKEFYENK